MTGKTFGDYVIGKELGKGGMATVYLARNNKFMTDVAIKVLNREFVYNDNIRSRFLSEARKIFRMSHPNIIRVSDLIDDGDLVAFVMDYVEGKTLKEWVEEKRSLTEKEIKTLFASMLDAVGYVHEQGIVHRDIKPSNFMIDRNGKPVLLDFGIAKTTLPASAEYTMTGTAQNLGTPMYMSPEQVRDPRDVLPQSDIYSLGVVLWQMVTCKKPYDASTLSTFDIQLKIVSEPLKLTGTIWDDLIQKATRKAATERYPDIRSFKDQLNTIGNSASTNRPALVDAEATQIYTAPNRQFSDPVQAVEKTTSSAKYIIIAVIVVAAGILIFALTRKKKSWGKKKVDPYTIDTITTVPQPTIDSADVRADTAVSGTPVYKAPDTPGISRLSEQQKRICRETIEGFYRTENAGNVDELMSYYRFPLRRYYSSYNVSYSSLRNDVITAFNGTLYYHNMEVFWDSFFADGLLNGGYLCTFRAQYGNARQYEDMKYKVQYLVIELDTAYKITAVYLNN